MGIDKKTTTRRAIIIKDLIEANLVYNIASMVGIVSIRDL